LYWANKIDQEGVTQDAVDNNSDVDISTDQDSVAANNYTPRTDSAEAMLRIPAALIDDMLRLVSESMIMTVQLQDRLQQAILQTRHVHEQNRAFQQLTYELEQLVDVRGINLAHSSVTANKSFDSLELDQYNELHTVTHRLVEAATDAREMTTGVEDHLTTLDNLLDDQERLHLESQDVVMRTRMVPVQNIIPRLQRCVRQTCRLTEKQVELQVQGAETLIDNDVLNELIDPIMHVIRNAIDHGIENAEQRNMSGKDAVGHILLSFAREGNQIVARCQDDGAGLDYASIRQTAVHKGLVDEDQELAEKELAHLILLPGFTTRNETTQTSGRGIGMDVVNNRVINMKGILLVDSRQGQGCIIELRIPLTMISVHGLIVRLHNNIIALSNRGVEQIVHAGDGHALKDGQSLSYHLDDTAYDAHSLDTLLNMSTDSHAELSERPVLLVRDDTNAVHAIFVEQVLANQEMVVKQLGQYIPQIAGIEGTTILGDGSVVPVVDLPGLLRTASADLLAPYRQQLDATEITSSLPCALVVDDSLSARRALAESVKDAGYEVLTAKDGLDAIEVMGEKRPDIMLVDLEMPRMNGLELASHVRASEVTRDIPIIMITSRSTEKHREQATMAGVDVYLTKPFDDGELHDHIQMQLNKLGVMDH
jgi:chemosensory pili system protein ChpA (sensor histidine kinase/response regulator)